MRSARTWDVFCRVIDNHGDVGVAWRLCADLASRGERVRMWIDDASALAWMAPDGHPGVERVAWTDPAPDRPPGDVVVETFGCDPPARFVQRMAALDTAPVWVNLEYLSAETYVERSHGLPSPVTLADGRLVARRFFYPGFGARTGGLLREPGLMAARERFDGADWLRRQGLDRRPGERVVSLFCYANPALPAMLGHLSAAPTLLLVTPGAPTSQLDTLLGASGRIGALRSVQLPWLTQAQYDRLLWSCDLNFVRGEDSFVRAQWAGQPFVWQIYPQADGAHAVKLQAFLDRMLAGGDDALAGPLRRLWSAWNGLAPADVALPPAEPWRALCRAWRRELLAQPDLATQLLGFIAETR